MGQFHVFMPVRLFALLLAACFALCLFLPTARAAEPAAAAGHSSSAGHSAPASPLLRVGIVPLRDDAEQPKLAASLSRMLQARLAARFKGVEFVVLDPESLGSGLGDTPLLLNEAVNLGQAANVDALLDGSFGGVQIAGGSWPSMTASEPQARGKLRWRLVECTEGLLLADGKIDPDRYKAYSQRIRTEKELEKRVLQDLVLSVGDELEKLGRLPKRKGEMLTPSPPDDADPISLTGNGSDKDTEKDDAGNTGEAEASGELSDESDSQGKDSTEAGQESNELRGQY